MDTTFTKFLQDAGWIGFFLYVAWRELWPWLRDKVVPERARARREERKIAAAAAAAEHQRLANLEERQVAAFEQVANAVDAMSQSSVIQNERLSLILTGLSTHDNVVREAIANMRERTARLDASRSRSRRKPSEGSQ